MLTSQADTDNAGQAGEQSYRLLFEHMPICIFVNDLTATPMSILEANRRAELVYGYTAAEFVGMPASHLIPEAARPAGQAILRRVQ